MRIEKREITYRINKVCLDQSLTQYHMIVSDLLEAGFMIHNIDCVRVEEGTSYLDHFKAHLQRQDLEIYLESEVYEDIIKFILRIEEKGNGNCMDDFVTMIEESLEEFEKYHTTRNISKNKEEDEEEECPLPSQRFVQVKHRPDDEVIEEMVNDSKEKNEGDYKRPWIRVEEDEEECPLPSQRRTIGRTIHMYDIDELDF